MQVQVQHTRMNAYEQHQVLGTGTYGTCHLVRELASGRFYALKRIPLRNEKDSLQADKEAQVRALRDVHALARVRVPSTTRSWRPSASLAGTRWGTRRDSRAARLAQVLAGLRHPHVLAYHESFSDESHLCIVMELCEARARCASSSARAPAAGLRCAGRPPALGQPRSPPLRLQPPPLTARA